MSAYAKPGEHEGHDPKLPVMCCVTRLSRMTVMDAVLQFVAKIMVVIFFAGVIGSMVVVLISFVEDLELLIETDDERVDAARPRA
jgi:hypothetical protein